MLCRQVHFNIRAAYIIHTPCICPHSVYRFPVYLYSCNHFLHNGFYFLFLIDLPSINGTIHLNSTSACCTKFPLCIYGIMCGSQLCHIFCHVLSQFILIFLQPSSLIKNEPVSDLVPLQCYRFFSKYIYDFGPDQILAFFQWIFKIWIIFHYCRFYINSRTAIQVNRSFFVSNRFWQCLISSIEIQGIPFCFRYDFKLRIFISYISIFWCCLILFFYTFQFFHLFF